ncbi:Membrane protein involved in colicin uptake [uncultured Clostridium sp.]|nr:Membrane protein involved in colicin uptake [uncultured Clostridium sp.]
MKFIRKTIDKFKRLSKIKKFISILVVLPVILFGGIFLYATSVVLIDTVFGTDISKTVNNVEYNAEQERLKAEEEQKQKEQKEKQQQIEEEKEEEKEENDKTEDISNTKNNNTKEETQKTKENNNDRNVLGNIVEKPVMNGFKTERIGTYAEVMVGGREINKENLVKFYESVVKDSGYKWVTLNIDGENGIVFPGASYVFTYGEIDDEGCITKSIGNGSIADGKVSYE